MVELSDLDSNKYDRIIRFKASVDPRIDSIIHTEPPSNIRKSENGDNLVCRLKRPNKHLSPDEELRIIASYQNGKNTNELAENMGAIAKLFLGT